VNHINKPTRYAANLQTPKTPDSVIAPAIQHRKQLNLYLERFSFYLIHPVEEKRSGLCRTSLQILFI